MAGASASGAVGVIDNPVRGRANARFFAVVNRYANWVTRHAKDRAFADLSGPTIVEIGPGVGANLQHLPDGATVVAVEPNVHMHPLLRRRAASRGLDLQLHPVGAESIPMPDGSADEVVCTLVLCTVPDPEAVLAEVHRVLRPGGRFRFVEHIVAPEGTVRRAVQRRLHRPWSWAFEGCQLDRDTPAMLQSAGFADVDYTIGSLRRSVFYPINRAVWGVATR